MAEETKGAPATPAKSTGRAKVDPAAQAVVNRGDLDRVDPAAQALVDAREQAERTTLTREAGDLEERLGVGTGDMPLAVLRAYVDGLRQAAARAPQTGFPESISAGVAADLEQRGYAVGENGETYVRNGGSVEVTLRGSGDKKSMSMPEPYDPHAGEGRKSGQDK